MRFTFSTEEQHVHDPHKERVLCLAKWILPGTFTPLKPESMWRAGSCPPRNEESSVLLMLIPMGGYSITEGGEGRAGDKEGFFFCWPVKVQTEPEHHELNSFNSLQQSSSPGKYLCWLFELQMSKLICSFIFNFSKAPVRRHLLRNKLYSPPPSPPILGWRINDE